MQTLSINAYTPVEKLPPAWMSVLVYIGHWTVGYLDKDGWYWADNHQLMPEPPEQWAYLPGEEPKP